MVRLLAAALLLTAGCKCKTDVLDATPTAPDAPVLPHGFRAPTLSCSIDPPAGWTLSASPMPDHILEVLSPDLHGHLIAQEALEPTLAEAATQTQARTLASWGKQPEFLLLREDPLAEGRLLVYQWGNPAERHLIALLPQQQKVVLVFADAPAAVPEAALIAALGTLHCGPKRDAAP